MEKLTKKEEEIMELFWKEGPLFIREMVALYEEPKPHFNTLSTMTRLLESKGFVGHKSYGPTYQYYPLISKQEFRSETLKNLVDKYFDRSCLEMVSALVEEEDISLDELKQLIVRVEEANKSKEK